MKRKIDIKLKEEIENLRTWYKGNTDDMILAKAGTLNEHLYPLICKLTITEFVELIVNGYEVIEEYNIVNLPNVFRFTIPKGASGSKYLCTVVKDRAVITWYDTFTENVNSYEYSVQEVLHHLNYKTWKMGGSHCEC